MVHGKSTHTGVILNMIRKMISLNFSSIRLVSVKIGRVVVYFKAKLVLKKDKKIFKKFEEFGTNKISIFLTCVDYGITKIDKFEHFLDFKRQD